jgi:cytoskeleton protein RodZ
MSEPPYPGAEDVGAPAPTAGDQLRAARESHGLSIDAVAQHLKLAPRQVRALEDGDFAKLPGRTFIRGFARNYARLMQLDADAIVAALPEAQQAPPPLDTTPLAASGRAMGVLPVSGEPRGIAWSRWAILLAIAALAAVAVMYETTRDEAPRSPDQAAGARRVPADPIGPSSPIGTPLQNPLVAGDAGTAIAPGPAPPAGTDQQTGGPAAPSQADAPSLPITAGAGAPAPAAEAKLVITYTGPAWTEVRDANGQRLLLVTGAKGSSETVSGTPPVDLTIGNALNASITWRGAPFDLAPHVKANIARVRLP